MSRLATILVTAALLFAAPPPTIAASCVPSATELCLLESRFTARISWNDGTGEKQAFVAEPQTDGTDSAAGLFFYYVEDASNWEILVKMIDGCRTNDHFWVLVAGSTGFGWTLEVTDEATGVVRSFTHPLDGQASGLEDFEAFATCGAATAPGATAAPSSVLPVPTPAPPAVLAPAPAPGKAAAPLASYPCISSGFDLCLLEGRFRATLAWNDGSGPRPAYVAPPRTDGISSASGLFYFYAADPSNWESLVKVIDGCRTNDAFWVLVSAATGFGWELTVTDELAGVTKTFTHPLDGHASGVADFSSFTTCAVPTPTPAPTATPRPTPSFAIVEFREEATCLGEPYGRTTLTDPNHFWITPGHNSVKEVVEPTLGTFEVVSDKCWIWNSGFICNPTYFGDVWQIEHGYRYAIIHEGEAAEPNPFLRPTDTLRLANLGPIYGDVGSAFLGRPSGSLTE